MTTNITITINGDYVSEGFVVSEQTWQNNGVENYTRRVEEFKIGPGNTVSRSFSVNHGATVAISMTERDATEEEKAEVKARNASTPQIPGNN